MKIFCTYDKIVTDSVCGSRYIGDRINIFYKLSYDVYALSSSDLSILRVTHINFDNYYSYDLLWFGGINANNTGMEWLYNSDKILYMDADYEAVVKKKSYIEALE